MDRQAERALGLPDAGGGLTGRFSGVTGNRSNALDRVLLRAMVRALAQPDFAITLWDGYTAGPPAPGWRVRIADRAALWYLMRNPLLHFGDLYAAARLEVEGDLTGYFERLYRGIAAGSNAARRSPLWWLWRDRPPRPGTPEAARENIHHHYDLGNAFYRLWLDAEAMQYTCAYFPAPAMTLEQGQRAKLEHVCRKLRLRPGQRVFEAGCGWGGLALHMAREHGVTVRAWNISREQVRYANEEARRQGLAGRVEFIEDDYREIRGECDVFVSVGMLEHVGPANYSALGAVIDRCLAPAGTGLIHTIGRNSPRPMNGWIERRIFPGAYPPTPGEMAPIFEPYDLSILDVENLRLHYAETLGHWLERFTAAEPAVSEMYDELFVRAWRLYLAGSQAAFTTGSLQLFQVLFARAGTNDLPRSRAHLYA